MSRRAKGIIPEFKSMQEVLAEAIAHERESNEFYMEASRRTDDPELRRFLQLLAETELQHESQLEEMLEKVHGDITMISNLMSSFGEPPL